VNDKNNLNIEKNNGVLILNIKSIIKVFRNRKWWFFVVTFIIVLILSLLFSSCLYKNSHYGVKSQISISLNNSDYNVMISNLFPEESAILWLNLTEENILSYLGSIMGGINNGLFINELNKSLNFNLSTNKLRELISFNIDDKNNKLIITTYYDDPETATKINESLTQTYTSNMINYFNNTYNVLLSKIEKKISEDQLNGATEEYNTLISLQKYLTENKDTYINRIFVKNLPEIERNPFILREVFISLFISIFAGIITIYIVNFVYANKKKKNL
jgi:hypothetical protein